MAKKKGKGKEKAAAKPAGTVGPRLGGLEVGAHFTVTRAGLRIDGKPTLADLDGLLARLRLVEQSVQFAIGDAINYAEATFGEEASQIVDAADWSEATVKVYRWVAEKVAPENRMLDRGLTFSHHMAVAGLTPAKQRKWLEQAAGEDGKPWRVSRLKAAMKEGGDQPVTRWWLLVECKDAEDATDLQKKLELESRTVKTLERRGPAAKAAKPEAEVKP